MLFPGFRKLLLLNLLNLLALNQWRLKLPQQGARVDPEMQEIPLEGEVVKLGDKEIRETSSLRDLRWACKFLRIGHTGAKSVLWQRLQKEIALNKLKAAVQASDAVT